MPLILTEEEQLLKKSFRDLLKEKGGIPAMRKLRDTKDPLGYDLELWKAMTEMGLTGLVVEEAYGGMDFGYTGLGQVLEETGRTLSCSPLISTVLLGTTALRLGANAAQKEKYLPGVLNGEQIIALAIDEGVRHQPTQVETRFEKEEGEGFLLTGSKKFVLDGHVADHFVVSAKDTDGKIQLLIVDTKAAGITIERVVMMDSRNAAKVSFEQVRVEGDALLSAYNGDLLQRVLDIGCIGLAAEMLGGIQEAFARTLAYLKERQQFGVPIGSFQALQHRAAIMFGEIELCKSVVIKALKAIDEEDENLSRYASLAKAKLGEVYKLVSNEGIQMFGGIGMTDDEEIGFFLKRARVAQQTFGDTAYHLDRLAEMREF